MRWAMYNNMINLIASKVVIDLPVLIALTPTVLPIASGNLCSHYTHKHVANALWAYPLNGVISLIGIAVQPLASLISLIAAGIFKLLSCCAEDVECWETAAEEAFQAGALTFIGIYVVFARIFVPEFLPEWVVEAANLKDLKKDVEGKENRGNFLSLLSGQ